MWGFLVRKATHKHIARILRKEGFVFTDETVKNLLKGNQKGVRYGNIVLLRNESGSQQKRFLKIMLDGALKTYRLFERQVKMTAALHAGADYRSPTLAVIKYELAPPVPYAIFDTRENGDGFGFMHDSQMFYERFTEQEMRKLVETIFAFHRAGFDVKKSALKLARRMPSELSFYRKEFAQWLDARIPHKTKEGREMIESVENLLIMYTGLTDIRARIMRTLEKNFSAVDASKTDLGSYLVHADMQIDNVYKDARGDFELLDFEWVGKSDNPVIPLMFDYGNLRARAWSSPRFQEMLDKAMQEVGMKMYPQQTEMVRASLTLGILRSSLLMSRYHMDVANTVKKDKRTEADYLSMFPKTVAALRSVIASSTSE